MNKSSDLEFNWFVDKYGSGWEVWREVAATWLNNKTADIDSARNALNRFLEEYLLPQFITDPLQLFNSECDSYDKFLKQFNLSDTYSTKQNNEVCDFIDWLISEYYTEPDDNGDMVALFQSPFNKVKHKANKLETVYNSLPYAYIKRLRNMLCPMPFGNFKDWRWAIEESDKIENTARHFKGWMFVDKSIIDKNDPDCVWKSIVLTKNKSLRMDGVLRTYHAGDTLYFIWSPVRAMALYLKLQLPLRTYQVRMLDSGEGDTWRYENKSWVTNNKHTFVEGSEKRPWQKGIFRRIKTPDIGDIMTGLYINTNKTADRNKDEVDRGYVIPWQHEEVLYWLEKLRNWQEKYNPISAPTSIHSLEFKHFNSNKSEEQRNQLGDICFLFRNAGSSETSERKMPITDGLVNGLWFALLLEFENRLYEENVRLSDGRKINFIAHNERGKTLFPLHCLRVSLITCYALEGDVPAPVLSKLLVGHSRLIMTMHYTKITPTMMAKKMQQAESNIDSNEDESLQTFLLDQSLKQIALNTVYKDIESVSSVLRVRNPAGWQEKSIGVCLVGGNTSRTVENATFGGCWNGGDNDRKSNKSYSGTYNPVPHGLENCIRCRWFITDIRYIHALTAHFNNLSYQATQSAQLASELEEKQEQLLDDKYYSELNQKVFTKDEELRTLDRRIEKQKVDADEYCKDLVACFQIIQKIKKIEEQRVASDNKQKVVAVGSAQDITPHFSFFETESELRQLIQVCHDAEIYPDLGDELKKSPAITNRSNYLNKALMKSGYTPFFMQLDQGTQLVAGNLMIKAMVEKTSIKDEQQAINTVAEYLDAQTFLEDVGLLDAGISAIEKQVATPILRLTDLINTKQLKDDDNE